jgi:hypothetical protein
MCRSRHGCHARVFNDHVEADEPFHSELLPAVLVQSEEFGRPARRLYFDPQILESLAPPTVISPASSPQSGRSLRDLIGQAGDQEDFVRDPLRMITRLARSCHRLVEVANLPFRLVPDPPAIAPEIH